MIGWLRTRYNLYGLLVNLVNYAWFPLLAGIALRAVNSSADFGPKDAQFYLLVFGVFLLALAVNFAVTAAYLSYVEATRFWTKVRRALVPLLPSELASALLAVGVVWSYYEIGLGHEVPFPSLADVAYLAAVPFAALGVFVFTIGTPNAVSRSATVLDGSIMAGSLLLVSWVTVLGSVYQPGSESLLALVISLAYPIGDVVVLMPPLAISEADLRRLVAITAASIAEATAGHLRVGQLGQAA